VTIEVTPRFKVEAAEAKAHVDWIHTLPCCVPGCRRTPIHSHHATTKGAGGQPKDLTPLCWFHHIGPRGVHNMGRHTWEREHGVALLTVAAKLAEISRALGRLPAE
jgi:hypothetical protein